MEHSGAMGTRALRAVLFCLFLPLYLITGRALSATGVFKHDDAIFQSDTWRSTCDATEPAADHYRTKVHPLFVLFFNPLGNPLRKATGSSLLVAVALVASAGALCVVIAHAVFTVLGLSRVAAVALSCLLGLSTSHLVFGSIPDTFIVTALSFTVCCWLALRRPGARLPAVPAGVFSMGIATTNLVPSMLLFAAGARQAGGFLSMLRKSAALLLAVLAVTAGLSLLQKRLYPSANLFFVPDSFREDTHYTFVPHTRAEAADRGSALLRHLTVFSLIAAEPRMWTPQGSEVPWVSFQEQTLADLPGAGRLALGFLLAVYGVAIYGIFRRRLLREPVFQGLLLGIAFLALLHYFYGDDLFLYSCSWVFLVLAAVAWGLQAASQTGARWARTVDLLLVLLTVAAAANNLRFLSGLVALYRGNPS